MENKEETEFCPYCNTWVSIKIFGIIGCVDCESFIEDQYIDG